MINEPGRCPRPSATEKADGPFRVRTAPLKVTFCGVFLAAIVRQSAQIAPVDGVVARTLERLLRTRSRTVQLYGLLFATDRRSPVLSSCHVGAYIPVGCQSEPTANQQDFVAAPLTHRREEWQRAVCMIWLEHSTEENVHLLGDLLALVGQRAMTAVC